MFTRACSKKPLIAFVLMAFVQSCGRGDFDEDLGSNFRFSYTSSIGMRIKWSGEVIVDTAVIDYEFDDRFIAAVRVPGVSFICHYGQIPSESNVAANIGFLDQLEFVAVEKSSKSMITFGSLPELKRYLHDVHYSGKVDLNSSRKDVVRNMSPIERIDADRCKARSNQDVPVDA